MLAIMAVVTWLLAGALGLKLLLIWIRGGGTGPRRSHIRPALIFGHAAFAVAGLLLVVAYLLSGEPDWLAWSATVVILTASLLGAAMYIPWWRRRRQAIKSRTAERVATTASRPITSPATRSRTSPATGATTHPAAGGTSDLPVERHFPVRVVIVHGLIADLTLALVLLTALGIGS
jgi:hypothetical protein